MDQNQQDNKELWDSFLNFLCLELFGVEVFDYYRAGKGTLEEVGPKDTPVEMELADHEVKLWQMADAVSAYVLDNKFHLTTGRLGFLMDASAALRRLFWALARSHEESFRFETLEVRKGGPKGVRLVNGGGAPSNPILEILGKIGR